MPFQPANWNVLILGAWNRAILTPEWIGTNIFQLPKNTPISLDVPINIRGPWRVKHQGVAVVVHQGYLEFVCEVVDYPTMASARKLAIVALTELPKTPVSAVGFNLRFNSEDTPPELAGMLTGEIDKAFSDAKYEIVAITTNRSLRLNQGFINCELTIGENSESAILLNFHRASQNREVLTEWLDVPIEEVKQHCNSIISSLKGVVIEPTG